MWDSGDSSLIITPKGKSILIDGGGSEMGDFNVGEKTLLPYLLNRKISSLEYAIISHYDADHCDGVLYLMQNIKIKQVIIGKQFEESENYKEFLNIIKEKNIKVKVVQKGERITIEKNIYFNVLWPDENNIITQNNLNNNSLVLKLYYKNFTALFTGDIEEIAEEKILQNIDKRKIKSTLIKIAHHGSKTSSTEQFINNVEPKIALIGVGKNNKFGHPNEGVLERLNKLRY